MSKLLQVALLLLWSIHICFAAPDSEVVDVAENYATIGKSVSFLAEKKQALSLKQVRQAFAQNQFKRSNQSVLDFGIGAKPHWITVKVTNETGSVQKRRLVIKNAWLDLIDIYVIDSNGSITHKQLGDRFAFAARGNNERFYVFDHDYLHGDSRLFIRVETPDPMIVPIGFSSLDNFYHSSTQSAYSYGLLYGILIALLLYNAILYTRIRQPRYLFYVIYLLSFIMMNLSYTGHGFQWLWPDDTVLEQWSNPLLINLYVFAGVVFAFSFLNTRRLFPRVLVVSYVLGIGIAFVQVLLFRFGMQSASVMLAIIQSFLFPIAIMTLALFSVRRHREAIYFVIATFAGFCGTVATSITVLNLIPFYELAYRGVEIGLAIDAILLSFALAEQFRIAEEEKKSALSIARQDALTGLYNRRAFYEMTKPIWHNSIRYDKPLSVAMIDIDHFKSINDNYGHSEGDKVIQQAAKVMQQTMRRGDILARWGGEEFLILLPQTDLKQSAQLAERILQLINQQQVKLKHNKIKFSVSIGVAERTSGTETLEDLIAKADHRLYQAKQNGRAQVCAERLT